MESRYSEKLVNDKLLELTNELPYSRTSYLKAMAVPFNRSYRYFSLWSLCYNRSKGV